MFSSLIESDSDSENSPQHVGATKVPEIPPLNHDEPVSVVTINPPSGEEPKSSENPEDSWVVAGATEKRRSLRKEQMKKEREEKDERDNSLRGWMNKKKEEKSAGKKREKLPVIFLEEITEYLSNKTNPQTKKTETGNIKL